MAKKQRKPPESPEELDANLDAFISTFQNESDRGAVLVATALLDDVLEGLLRCRMSQEPHIKKRCVDPLFMPEAALGTFAAKIKIARAFEILGDWMYEDLEIIRKVRNEFAHSHLRVDFSEARIVKLSRSLKAIEHAPAMFEIASGNETAASEARFRFLLSASYLIFIFDRNAAVNSLSKQLTDIDVQLEAEGGE
jgi:DNA-binding MltR family transcriptional regulator